MTLMTDDTPASPINSVFLDAPVWDNLDTGDFYVESLYISVENSLFEIPRYYFEQNSDLAPIISPRPREEHGAGWFKDKPISLGGFTAEEFGAFLRLNLGVLLGIPRPPSAPPPANSPEEKKKVGIMSASIAARLQKLRPQWESILKVATLLGFQEERNRAISAITPSFNQGSNKDRMTRMIHLARLYQVDVWLSDLYTNFVNRDPTLEAGEIKALGYEVAITLLQMRDRGFKPTGSIEDMIKSMVKSELMDAKEAMTKLSISLGEVIPVQCSKLSLPTSGVYNTMVLKLQNQVFRVPAKVLTDASRVFSDLFKRRQERDKSDECMIELNDVCPTDFRSLLHAIWPPGLMMHSVIIEEDQDYWISVLKLSTKWSMQTVRSRAIDQLSPQLDEVTRGDVLEKVALARQYNVRKWLIEAYQTIGNRESSITPAERDILGWDIAYGLLELRDVNRRLKITKNSEGKEQWALSRVSLKEVEAQFPEASAQD